MLDIVSLFFMNVCRCEDMVDVRRLKMLQMVQLFKCEEDASQVRRGENHPPPSVRPSVRLILTAGLFHFRQSSGSVSCWTPC